MIFNERQVNTLYACGVAIGDLLYMWKVTMKFQVYFTIKVGSLCIIGAHLTIMWRTKSLISCFKKIVWNVHMVDSMIVNSSGTTDCLWNCAYALLWGIVNKRIERKIKDVVKGGQFEFSRSRGLKKLSLF